MMDPDRLLTGTFIMVMGGIALVRPDLYVKLQIWQSKKILGAKFVPSRKTYIFYRWMGIFLFLLGLLVLAGRVS